jgi:hypothetical protein
VLSSPATQRVALLGVQAWAKRDFGTESRIADATKTKQKYFSSEKHFSLGSLLERSNDLDKFIGILSISSKNG